MILIAFNQEHYIDEAIDGALAQDYPNLEIILSDDCSTDTTFARMQVRADDYRGPHKLRLNRNEKNLGIIGHVNRVAEMATGELIVAAAGDDISYPHRVTATVNLWEKYDRRPDYLYFNYEAIGEYAYPYKVDSFYHSLQWQIQNGGAHLKGATGAFTKRLYEFFGPIDICCYAEDKALPFRAELMDGCAVEDLAVIKYRIDKTTKSIFGKDLIKLRETNLTRRKGHYLGFVNDLNRLCAKIETRATECLHYEKKIKKQLGRINRELNLYAKSAPRRGLGLFYLMTGLTWTRWPLRKKLSLAKLVVLDMAGRLE
jgi:glycosyltransferase involved in cell wall biosynthesis